MRALVQHGPRDLRLEERPVPRPGPGEVLVRVRANGLCGSDLHFFEHALYGPGVVLGHEIAGEVAGLGEGVTGLTPGMLGAVYSGIPCGACGRCRAGLEYYCVGRRSLGTGGPSGGLAEYVVAPAANFLGAPAASDPAVLALSEPLANGLRCLDHPEVRGARSALVVGGGPIGLACLVAARRLGVERVWVVEGRGRRREAAHALGAERVLQPAELAKELLHEAFPGGPDVVVEAVGSPETIQSCLRLVRPGGTVLLMGVCLGTFEVQPVLWMLNELTIRSSLGCDRDAQRTTLRWLLEGTVEPGVLLTRRVPLEEAPAALAALSAGADEIKVVVEHAGG
jgi:threonine dehydrogenase-like Zn-dependent dehydrogenase